VRICASVRPRLQLRMYARTRDKEKYVCGHARAPEVSESVVIALAKEGESSSAPARVLPFAVGRGNSSYEAKLVVGSHAYWLFLSAIGVLSTRLLAQYVMCSDPWLPVISSLPASTNLRATTSLRSVKRRERSLKHAKPCTASHTSPICCDLSRMVRW